MLVVVSPYHLTTREPPAMAALLLADRIVTLLPEPGRDEGAGPDRRALAELSARVAPGYLRLLRSWEWLVPLWREGVLCGSIDGDDPGTDVTDACRRIAADDRYAELRPLMRPDSCDEPAGQLHAVAADLLKGGPDPAFSVPISAALDRFAVRHGACVARASAVSIAQRAEERLGRPLVSIGLPVLLRASGDRLLEAREALVPPLMQLRAVLDGHMEDVSRVRAAAREYARAFEAAREELTEPDGDEGRTMAGTVMIAWRRLPVDAVLESSAAAYRSATGLRGGRTAAGAALAERDPLAGRQVVTMVVRTLGSAS
ncbi:MAG: hypothetical protein IT437_02175 [Phycisphaerales bacterium]|nr:hypothetical protein [Phycisphaerales bacterium]